MQIIHERGVDIEMGADAENCRCTTLFFLKNSFYKNIKALFAKKIRTMLTMLTMLRILKALNFLEINVLVEFFKKLEKISKI